MAYYTSNTAYALDMDVAGAAWAPEAPARRAPEPERRPRFDVYTGAGREADQIVSPAFMHVLRLFCIIAVCVVAIGLARVTIASATAGVLNANAAMSNELTEARDESADLEVMRSVYGADTRIRDLATGALGMCEPAGRVTLDVSDPAPADATSGTPEAAPAAQ